MPAKFDRCVKKVSASLRRRGEVGNPFAICRAALKKASRKARENPLEMKPSFEGVHKGRFWLLMGLSAATIGAVLLLSPKAESTPANPPPPQPPTPDTSQTGAGPGYNVLHNIYVKTDVSGGWFQAGSGWDSVDGYGYDTAARAALQYNAPAFDWYWSANDGWLYRSFNSDGQQIAAGRGSQ